MVGQVVLFLPTAVVLQSLHQAKQFLLLVSQLIFFKQTIIFVRILPFCLLAIDNVHNKQINCQFLFTPLNHSTNATLFRYTIYDISIMQPQGKVLKIFSVYVNIVYHYYSCINYHCNFCDFLQSPMCVLFNIFT